MKKLSFLKCFVETLLSASESLVKTLRATSLLGMMVLAPMGATAQVTIGSGDLPQATLDIIGDTLNVHGEAFRLIDGNQALGKILTCQENGIGTWQPNCIEGKFDGSQLFIPFADNTDRFIQYAGASITLPPGKWVVISGTLLTLISDISALNSAITADNFAWVRFTLSDSPADGFWTASGDLNGTDTGAMIRGPFLSSHNLTYEFANRELIINNTSGADKTYYLMAGYVNSNSNFTIDEIRIRVTARNLVAIRLSN